MNFKPIEQPKRNPYIVIKYMSAVYQRIDYLSGTAKELLINDAKEISETRNFRTCVVVSENECYFIELDGSINKDSSIPEGGVSVNYNLRT